MDHPLGIYRREKGITRTQMAHLIGCDVSYVGHIEEGRRRPSPEMARMIEQATGGEVKVMDILFPERPGQVPGKSKPSGGK
jgi:transcriptional regulator with XRE-family HTH domain